MENKQQPEIRFLEFSDKWSQHKLGDLGTTFTGISGKTKEDFGRGVAEFVTYMNVFSNPISDIKMTGNVEIDSNQNELKYGDVLFTTSSETPQEVGMSSVWLDNRKNVYLNSFCFGFRPIVDLNSLYMAYLLRSTSIREQMMLLAQGISRYNISKNKAMEILVKLPSIEEQSKIGSFFKQLDQTITLQQQELKTLKQTKQGFLQRMFPKEGEKFPEVRFKGYNEKWEVQTLNNIFNIIDGDRGKNYPGINDFKDIGDTIFLDTGNVKKTGFDFSVKKFISKEKDDLLRSGKLILNDFVLTSRGTLGNIAYYDKLFSELYPSVRINSAMLILRPIISDRISNDYMSTVLRGSIVKTFMSKNHVGSAQPHITKGEFSKLKIGVPPTLDEQIKIGEFFKQLDQIIELKEKELEALKQTKKAFLQKMFV